MTTNNGGTPPEELGKVLRLIYAGQGLLFLAAPMAWSSGQDGAPFSVWIAMVLAAVGLFILKLAASRIRRVKLSLLEPVGEQRLLAFLGEDLEGTGGAGPQVST